jgi:hypothetical protein
MEDEVLSKAQRGLFFGKPKFGVFVIACYKKELTVDDPAVRDGIVGAACEVIKYALKLENEEGSGKEMLTIYLLSC